MWNGSVDGEWTVKNLHCRGKGLNSGPLTRPIQSWAWTVSYTGPVGTNCYWLTEMGRNPGLPYTDMGYGWGPCKVYLSKLTCQNEPGMFTVADSSSTLFRTETSCSRVNLQKTGTFSCICVHLRKMHWPQRKGNTHHWLTISTDSEICPDTLPDGSTLKYFQFSSGVMLTKLGENSQTYAITCKANFDTTNMKGVLQNKIGRAKCSRATSSYSMGTVQ